MSRSRFYAQNEEDFERLFSQELVGFESAIEKNRQEQLNILARPPISSSGQRPPSALSKRSSNGQVSASQASPGEASASQASPGEASASQASASQRQSSSTTSTLNSSRVSPPSSSSSSTQTNRSSSAGLPIANASPNHERKNRSEIWSYAEKVNRTVGGLNKIYLRCTIPRCEYETVYSSTSTFQNHLRGELYWLASYIWLISW